LSTRQRRNNPYARAAVPLVCATLLAYFGFHSWHGRYGIQSMNAARDEIVRLEFELARVGAERKTLEARVRLLRDGTIERDMLDEQARMTLNLVNANELIVMRPQGAN
jgi:cell division protein FtsB